MFAKTTRNRVQFDFEAHLKVRNAPHILYANLDFESEHLLADARRLLKWLDFNGPDEWKGKYRRTLMFLKKRQKQFQDCLRWITEGCEVDFSADFESDDRDAEYKAHDRWEKHPPLRFFRKFLFVSGEIVLQPEWQECSRFSGLRLAQRKVRDPLAPICWHVLSMLVHWGNTFVRQCRHESCGKFFAPPTRRRIFCSDSCRALHYAEYWSPHLLEDDDAERRRKNNREYMRRYRNIPQVKRRTLKIK